MATLTIDRQDQFTTAKYSSLTIGDIFITDYKHGSGTTCMRLPPLLMETTGAEAILGHVILATGTVCREPDDMRQVEVLIPNEATLTIR